MNVRAPASGALRRRLEELGAIRPVPGLDGLHPDDPDGLARIAEVLAHEVERCQREIIEGRVQLLALHEVATGMFALAEPESAAEEIAHYLQRAFAFEQVFLFLSLPESRALAGPWRHPRESVPPSRRIVMEPREEGGGISHAFLEGNAVLVTDARLDPPFTRKEIIEAGDAGFPILSYAAVPLVGAREGGKVIGVLGAASSEPSRPVTRSERVTLESIAGSVAALAENAILYRALRRSERFRENLLDCVGSGIIAVDLEGRVIALNRLAERMSGFAESDALGKPARRFLAAGDARSDPLTQTLREGNETIRAEGELLRADGKRMPVSVSTSLLRDDTGRLQGAIATFVDLTPLREMEERVRHLDRLAALGRFTAGVAHEIRNPLAGIAAGVQYLARRFENDEGQRENVRFLTGEIDRLDRILRDLSSASQPAKPMIGPCRIPEIVSRTVRALESGADEKGVRFEIEAESGLKDALADADQIQQVLLNLLKNACEASPRGSAVTVTIRSRAPEGEGARCAVEIRVRDEGPGIRPEDRARIFEPFFTTKSSGTGLGLYVSHGIVERHGGSLTAESDCRTGSTFVLTLPAAT